MNAEDMEPIYKTDHIWIGEPDSLSMDGGRFTIHARNNANKSHIDKAKRYLLNEHDCISIRIKRDYFSND
jgi:hypothetical protein